MRYQDRADAGGRIAAQLRAHADEGALVLALPRGGVPVAAPIADALDAELDVLVARKLGAPGNPEFGVGAIAPGGVRVLDDASLDALRISREELDRIEGAERAELARREERYRGDRAPPLVEGRVVILVDDGIATGGTARAAILSVRAQHPARLILAVPVAPPATLAALEPLVDEIVCPLRPADLQAVGQYYDDFAQTTDADVLSLLARPRTREVAIDVECGQMRASLYAPPDALGIVLFAHGSGSSRWSPRNRAVARALQAGGLATMLVDLLVSDAEDRFDVTLLASRLAVATLWARDRTNLRVAYFGSSTGAAAALIAAARDDAIASVVSRGGRPDLAGEALETVRAPTLLLVGGADAAVLRLNQEALARLRAPARLDVIPGATHLFEEPGALEAVASRALVWLATHFR